MSHSLLSSALASEQSEPLLPAPILTLQPAFNTQLPTTYLALFIKNLFSHTLLDTHSPKI